MQRLVHHLAASAFVTKDTGSGLDRDCDRLDEGLLDASCRQQ